MEEERSVPVRPRAIPCLGVALFDSPVDKGTASVSSMLCLRRIHDEPSRDTAESSPSKIILGTHTSYGEQNYLMVASVDLPHSSQLRQESGDERKGGYFI